MRDVDHVDQEVRRSHLLERALEGLDQLVRELVNEADRVGEQHGQALRKAELPNGRVEGREQAVLDQHAGARELVHERRLARVRVADQRQGGERHRAPLVAVEPARALHVAQAAAELRDALAHAAAVDLELRLAGAPRAHAAAQAREVGPLPREARQEVLELRQLDLHLALERACPLREDVEDEGAAVDHLALAALLEVALLGG